MLRRGFTLACVLLCAAASHAAAAPNVDSAALLRKFEPVLYFHADEDWAPERADAFVARARVEKQTARGKWVTQTGALPTSTKGCTFKPCYRFNLPCALRSGDACYEKASVTITDWQKPVVYGRLLDVPAGTPPPAGFATAPRYLARYWLFYEFNDWRSPKGRLWQTHEADWESVTVGLGDALQPLFAAYSQHCSGTIRPWANVTKRGASHPVDYVAVGSHANYFTNAPTSTKLNECRNRYLDSARAKTLVKLAADRIVDRTGTAHASGPAGLAGTTPLELVELKAPLPRMGVVPGTVERRTASLDRQHADATHEHLRERRTRNAELECDVDPVGLARRVELARWRRERLRERGRARRRPRHASRRGQGRLAGVCPTAAAKQPPRCFSPDRIPLSGRRWATASGPRPP